jgi:hypothetical protein
MRAVTIPERAEVYCSCSTRLGTVERVKGKSIKLTKMGFGLDDGHHYVPVAWVDSVGAAVQLNKTCEEILALWQGPPLRGGGARAGRKGTP